MDIKKMYLDLCDEKQDILDKQEQIEELLTAATNTTMPLGEEKTYTIGGSKDRVGKIMDKVMDLEKEISRMRYRYNLKKTTMILGISHIESKNRKITAIDHYIRNRSLNQIAKNRKITQNAVCKSIAEARKELFLHEYCEK